MSARPSATASVIARRERLTTLWTTLSVAMAFVLCAGVGRASAADGPDIATEVSASQSVVTAGDELIFTISLTNAGTEDARGIRIDAPVPDGFVVHAFDADVPAIYEPGVEWVLIDPLPAGSTARFRFSGNATGTHTPVVQRAVARSLLDVDSSNDAGEARVDVMPGALMGDLELTVDPATASVHPGQPVTLTFRLSNRSENSIPSAHVAIPIPDGLEVIDARPFEGTTFADGSWLLTSPIDPGTSHELVVDVRRGAESGTIEGFAHALCECEEIAPENNVASYRIELAEPVAQPDFVVNVTPTTVTPSQAQPFGITYTVSNIGNAAGGPPVISTGVPLGLRLDQIILSSEAGSFDSLTGTWAAGSELAPGESREMTLMFTAIGAVGTRITQTVEVACACEDQSLENNTSQFDLVIAPGLPPVPTVDLSVHLAVSSSTVTVGIPVSVMVDVANEGPAEATGVRVDLLMPAGLTLLSSQTSASYDASRGQLLIASIPAGSTAELTLVASSGTAGLSTMTAEVMTADQLDRDSTPANGDVAEDDLQSRSVQFVAGPQAQATAKVSMSGPLPGTRGPWTAYRLRVTNPSAVLAEALVVTARAPGARWKLGRSRFARVEGPTIKWTVGALAPGASRTVIVYVKTGRSGASTGVALRVTGRNVATVTSKARLRGGDLSRQGA